MTRPRCSTPMRFLLAVLVLSSCLLAAPPPASAQPYVFSGRVYEGQICDESSPLTGVVMELYGSNDVGWLGGQIGRTTTDHRRRTWRTAS